MRLFKRKTKELPPPEEGKVDLYPTMTNGDPSWLGWSLQTTASFHSNQTRQPDEGEDWTLFLTVPKEVRDYLQREQKKHEGPIAFYWEGGSGGSNWGKPDETFYITLSTRTCRFNGQPNLNSLNHEAAKRSHCIVKKGQAEHEQREDGE